MLKEDPARGPSLVTVAAAKEECQRQNERHTLAIEDHLLWKYLHNQSAQILKTLILEILPFQQFCREQSWK